MAGIAQTPEQCPLTFRQTLDHAPRTGVSRVDGLAD